MSQQVAIYRQNQAVEIISLPTTLSGENVLPGLIFRTTSFLIQ
jgi:Uma2 family endonuclease